MTLSGCLLHAIRFVEVGSTNNRYFLSFSVSHVTVSVTVTESVDGYPCASTASIWPV